MQIENSQINGSAFVLTNGILNEGHAKTAHGLIRGSTRFVIRSIIDHVFAGKDAGEILDGKFRDIPVIGSLKEAIQIMGKPDFCIIGIANKGGFLPESMVDTIKESLMNGISVVNGLHTYLSEIPEMVSLAKKYKARLIDVRKPKAICDLHFWSPGIFTVACPVIAVLGTDCAVGKRTSARFLMQACNTEGIKTEMIYTGQTGWMQGAKYGFIVDSTLNDFVSGEVAHAILNAYQNENPDLILIEGQSSLKNPCGPCGSEFLLSGNARKVILVHSIKQHYFNDIPEWGEIPSVENEIRLIEAYGSDVIALMLNTKGCSYEEAVQSKENYHKQLNIPVFLPVEEGVKEIIPIIRKLTTL